VKLKNNQLNKINMIDINQQQRAEKMFHGKQCCLMIIGGLFLFQSLSLGSQWLAGAVGGAVVGAGGAVISELLTDDVSTERILNGYSQLDRKMRKGFVTTIKRTMWDMPTAQADIKTYKISYSSTYYQNTGSQIIKSNSSKPIEPVFLVSSSEELALGISKEAPVEVRDYFCLLTENDYDELKTKFGYRVQWKDRNGAPVKFYWKDKRRFKVILENWTSMPGKNCGEQYNGTGAWYLSPLIDRNSGNGEIICSPDKNLSGVINLSPNSSSQILFKEHVWP
jgi:hypothetical protein